MRRATRLGNGVGVRVGPASPAGPARDDFISMAVCSGEGRDGDDIQGASRSYLVNIPESDELTINERARRVIGCMQMKRRMSVWVPCTADQFSK